MHDQQNIKFSELMLGLGLGLGLFHFPSIFYEVVDHKDIEIVKLVVLHYNCIT